MQTFRSRVSVPGRLGLVCLGLVVCLGWAANSALGQPTNDNFANAQVLPGPTGSVPGGNVGATQEPGEVLWTTLTDGATGGASVWYVWTAPASGTANFNTEGSSFDTLLGVYTGNSVDNLTVVGENDDVSPSDLTSTVTFTAVQGTTYHIAVDGYTAFDQGTIVLSWNLGAGGPALFAGDFRFTSANYLFAEAETDPPISIVPPMQATPGMRLTITRAQGSVGRVNVGYMVTNNFYTNWLEVVTIVTNVYMTNFGSPPSYTNLLTTNILSRLHIQTIVDVPGGTVDSNGFPIVSCNPSLGFFVITSNSQSFTTNLDQNGSVSSSSFSTNSYDTNLVLPFCQVPKGTLMSAGSNTVTITNFFCSRTNLYPISPSATPGLDYVPRAGVLTFDDFQMSADILVTNFNGGSFNNPGLLIPNRWLQGVITSVALDTNESTSISPPTTNAIPITSICQASYEQNPNTGLIGTNLINFERATLRCSRNIGTARVWVLRTGFVQQTSSTQYRIDYLVDVGRDNTFGFNCIPWEVPLQAGSDYATPDNAVVYGGPPDFTSVSGTLNWPANGVPAFQQPIDIPILTNGLVNFNRDLLIQLWDPQTPSDHTLGNIQTCVLTILFDKQPAGANDRSYNPDNSAGTIPPYLPHTGPNNAVYALTTQPADGKAIIGGDFTAYNGGGVNGNPNINRIARVNLDGSLDQTFDPGDGADQFITTAGVDPAGNVLIAGAFTSINRIPRNHVARLTSNGTLDTTFFPGQGSDGTIWTLAQQTDGHVLIGGEFTFFNGTNRNYVARLNTDGSLDSSLDTSAGPDNFVHALVVQPDGKIVIAGDFTHVAGVSRNHVARLNTDGSLDTSFDPGHGVDGAVYALALQNDGSIVLGGDFHNVADVGRNCVARLSANGALDQAFDPGTGADDAIYSVTLQPDGGVILGGFFKSINQTRRVGLARLYPNGTLDTSFMDTAYNQFAGVINHFWDPNVEPPNFIYTSALQPDGNLLIAGSFERVGGGGARDSVGNVRNFARVIGGVTPGPGNISLAEGSYSSDQATDPGGDPYFVTMTRQNGDLGPASATISPVDLPAGPGAAVHGIDYTLPPKYANPVWITSWSRPTWDLSDGTYGQNQGFSQTVDPNGTLRYTQNDVFMTILNNTNAAGNKNLNLLLTNPNDTGNFLLGGQRIPLGVALGSYQASMTIVDYHTSPGVLSFSSPGYIVNEGGTNAVITVIRTNGSTGVVSAQYSTANGTATNGIHYIGVSGRLTFLSGQTNLTFLVPIIDENQVEHDHTVLLNLSTPSGGATLGLTNAVLTIIDNDVPGGYVEFNSPTYGVNENGGFALVTVNRNGSSAGTLTAQFAATNGTAVINTNFIPVVTNLVWNNGDVAPKTIAIPVIDDGIVETNNLTVNLKLYNPTLNTKADPAGLGNVTNATLFITNSDFVGQLEFSSHVYNVNENGGFATLTVVRTGGSAGPVSVNYATANASALAGKNYTSTAGTLFFGAGQVSKSFNVPILDDGIQDPSPFFFTASLSSPNPPNILSTQVVASVSILDAESFNEPPGGLDPSLNVNFGVNANVRSLALESTGRLLVGGDFTAAGGLLRNRIARFNPDGTLDTKFLSTLPTDGANGSVLAVLSQTDSRILIGGQFTTFDSYNRNYLARLTYSGVVDSTFNPGSGPDNPVFTVAETFVNSARKLLIGGAFLNYDSVPANYITSINDDGSLDGTFSTGQGPNGVVFAIALQPDGKAVIGGDFTFINGVARNHVARLNTDGSVDLGFDPAAGPNDSVRSIAVQLDGHILIGGLFTNVAGVTLNHVARLDSRGAVDPAFTPGLGANDLVSSITVQPDTRIVLGGQFTQCNGVTRGRITRLNNDGTLDTEINFGTGADSFVSSAVVQPNGEIIFGGGFTHYDGQPVGYLAEIFGGGIAGAGSFEFTAANYQVNEDGTNVVVTVRRRDGTSGVVSNGVYIPNVSVNFATSDFTAIAGTNYVVVATNLVFPPGETVQTVTIPVIRDFVITPNLIANLSLTNPQPAVAGGPVLGNQPVATLTIVNVDSAISFSSATYSSPENPLTGTAIIPIVRSGSTSGSASVDVYTTTNGTAIPYTNYIPTTNTVTFAPGQISNVCYISLIHTPQAEGNTTVGLQLTNVINSLLFNPSSATLTIVDVDQVPGQLLFARTNYIVSEGAGSVILTVLRTNGHTGAVTVNYATFDGTATAGNHRYTPTTGTLSFADGEISKTISVPVLQGTTVFGNQFFSVGLSNPSGGASLLNPTNVPVTILDDLIGVEFSSPIYVQSEVNGSVTLTVNRIGTNGTSTVHYATTNGTAIAGTNYQSASGTLTFAPGETIKTFPITLIHDPQVTGDLFFTVNLFNATDTTGPIQLATPSSATVDVLDVDPGFSFTNANFGVFKSGTNVTITVLRSNANTGDVSVSFATSNGTAVAGIDYTSAFGTLVFSNGIVAQSFPVGIINNGHVTGDRSFTISLFNPSAGAQLVPPSLATVTITDDVAGLSFSAPAYTENENSQGGLAPITVLRTGYTNSTVSVQYATADGSGVAGANYLPTSGTLVFTNGETIKTWSVQPIDDSTVNGDKTVLLGLSSPTGNSELVVPNQSTLTIFETDGSQVVAAGAALTHESGPVNGVIDPSETVTVLLGLRDATGTNAANVTATLLATNGVTNPQGNPQNYGTLVVHGPSVSRPFTFTANGTNGQVITASLQLTYGGTTNRVNYNFQLGTVTTTYSNSAPIDNNDYTNATPYPSSIQVTGLVSTITKVTATVTNLYHTWPSDIDMLLVSPSGTNSYLMFKCGGSYSITNVSLTFDSTAANSLPSSSNIVSGTYLPTSYAIVPPPFPAPAPIQPFGGNLTALNGSNPNGLWSLFIIDDTPRNAGGIANGWSLSLTTAGTLPVSADLGLAMTASQNTVVQTSNVTYTITLTNYGPASASAIVVSDTMPTGSVYVSSSPAGVTNALGQVSWNVAGLTNGGNTTFTVTVQPGIVGIVSNSATVSSATADVNPDNNSASVLTTVASPTADLQLSLIGSPNPLNLGSNVTFTITVTNVGPATAVNVVVTNPVPPGFAFVSASPGGSYSAGAVSFSPGNMGSGTQTSFNVVLKTTAAGTLNDTATCSSDTVDPLKGNNTASVKIVVLGPPGPLLGVTRSGNSVTIAWPAASGYSGLEYTTSLTPPVVWTSMASATITTLNGTNYITLPIGNGNMFYRPHP